ncbi:hypothetical protein [uncultured Microbulbifer sp.]|uniref:beta strand repeat-containing protein n=1 Tax=uncultured Microbulbifer sp. TaxID=348147 RepID=UPI0025D4FB25|nr:hypothetical protein [uncultured Microbulbifer sp.]
MSFTQVSSIQGDSTDVLNAMAGGSEFAVLGINRVESSGITFNGLGRIQGGTGADKVTGADQLTVASDGSNTVVTASESGGLVFRDIDTFSTNNGALTDNQGGETITLNSDSSIGVHGISFTGLASMAADGNGYLDASGFASGVTLNAANAVDASGLVVSGLSRVTVPLLYGTTAAETFRVSDTGGTTTIDVDGYGISFDGVSQVQAGEGSGDGDVLVAAQSIHHDISSDIFATLLGIDFYQLETLDLAGGTLSGTAGNDDFTLVNSNTVSHSANSAFNFRNVSGVTGGSGVTTLDATALATGLYLTSASGSSVATDTSDGITFDGLASVKASSLDTNGQGVTLTIDGPGAVSSGTVSFTQVSSIQGDNTDSVSGDASWVLSGSGAKSSLADILFSGQWRVTTSSGSLTGSDGADAFVLESNGTVSANGLNFAGLSNVVGGAGGDDLDASAYAGGISLAGADSRLSAAGIQFQDILSVTTDVLNALATGSEFEVLGANSVSTSGMIFNGVKNVAGGAGVDRVSGADNWTVNVDGGGNYLTATKSADLVFRNIDSFDTDNGSLTDTVGGGTILLNADSSIDVHNMSFTGLANLTADGSGDLDASGFIDGLALTGSDGEVAANALSIRGIATAKVSGLAGSAADDYFAIATNGDITARSMVFSGVSEVSAGSAGNAVGGADGFDWQIIDTDSAGNNGIAFHGFSDLTAVNAGLIGTAGDDLFTLSGSESAGASVAYEQMVFTGVSAVDGNGSAAAGDHLDAGAYSDSLSLTGVDKQLAAGGLTFSNFDSAELSVLYGSASDENFVVTGTDAIAIANLNISGLSEVYGEGGVNTLTALGKATLNKNGFARNGDIKFYSINEIIADSLDATDGDDLLAFDVDGNVTVNGYKISASTYVDAKGGNDTVTGVDGIDWTIQGASSAENNGVTFDNVEILEVVNAGLYGTANADVFNLDSAGLITIGNLSVSGMSFVDGNGGVDALNAVDLAGGLALTATAGALKAGDLDVFGMDSATAKILTGTGADEQFQLTGSGQLTDGNISFSGVQQLIGNGGSDSLSSTVNENWVLASGAVSVDHGNVNFSGISSFSGGSGVVQGHASGHSFIIEGDNKLAIDALRFSDIASVEAATGTDDVTTVAAVALGSMDNTFSSSNMNFSGVDSVTTSALVGSDSAAQYTLTGSGQLTVNDIEFDGLATVSAGSADSDRVLSRSGQNYALNADSTVAHDGIVFSGVEAFEGLGDNDLDASAFVAGLMLNGNHNEVVADGVTFAGLAEVTTGKLAGSAGSYGFTVSSSDLDVLSMLFMGVTDVTAGAGNSVTGADAVDWQIVDIDSAENSGIAFHGFNDLTASNAGLIGTSGDDTFVLSGSESAGALVAYQQMTFGGVSYVAGGGSISAGDHLDASGYTDALALNGSDNALLAGSLLFSGFDSAQLAQLIGHAGDDTFSVTGDGAVTVAGLDISGLTEVRGGGGSNTLMTEGTASLSEAGYTSSGAIDFYDIQTIIAGLLEATDGDDRLAFADNGNITVNGYEIGSSTYVDAKGGSDTVTGASAQNWIITGESSAENNGVTFANVEYLNAVGGGLYGTGAADSFTLGNDGSVTIGNLSIAGMSFIDGAGASDSLDASEYAAGIALASNFGELAAGSLSIIGIENVATAALRGSAVADEFSITGSGQLSASGVNFSGIAQLDGGGGQDLLTSELDSAWAMAAAATGVRHGDVSIAGIESLSGANGQLVGHADGHDFTVDGSQLVSVGDMQFADIVEVVAAEGADAVSAASAVTLGGVSGVFTTSDIAFSGIDSAVASDLIGSSAAEQFTLDGSGALSVNGIAFSGLSSVKAGDGDDDEVISRSGQDYELQADNSVQHESIAFSGVESFSGNAAQLVANGQASARITGSRSVATGAATFSGLDSLSLVGGATELVAWNGVTINGSGSVTSGGIQVTGVSGVSATGALIGTADDDMFAVSANNTLSSAGMTFRDVDVVAAGGGTDRVQGFAGDGWQLEGGDGALRHGAINFSGLEHASGGSGVVDAGDGDRQFSVTSGGQLLTSAIRFDGIHTVNAGSGNDNVATMSGQQWTLGEDAGSAATEGMVFHNIERVSTAAARVDASANSGAESFALAANSTELTVLGLIFGDVAEVIAGVAGGDQLTSAASDWQLGGGENRLSVNGVAFAGIDRVATADAQLTATAAAEQFALAGADNALHVAGIEFEGVQSVIGNGGDDALIGSDGDDVFALADDGDISAAGMLFSGIASVDSGSGVDSVSGDGAAWRSTVAQAGNQLMNGAAVAQVDSITVQFQNLERVTNTGTYSGPEFSADYHLVGANSLAIGGIIYGGLDSIAAGSAADTLYGVDADLSWVLGDGQGSLTDGASTLVFSGFESIIGGAGADQFDLNGGVLDSLNTGAGNDTVNLAGMQLDTLHLGAGDDLVAVLSDSQPATLTGGAGSDLLQMQLTGQQWQFNGDSSTQNQVGNFLFSQFENLQDSGGGLNLVTSQQFNFTANGDAAGVVFSADGMQLAYDPAGDLVLLSSAKAPVGGSLKARNADLTLAGDLDIETDVASLSLRTSGGDIDVAILAREHLQVGQIDVGRGNVSLASASANVGTTGVFGVLTAESFDDTHIKAGNIQLGTPELSWGAIGSEDIPLRLDATQSVGIVALEYYDPFFDGQQPLAFSATGDKRQSIAGAQTAQGLKSAVQNPVDDIAQLDPGIFSEVTPYSLGVDPLNLPEVRLHAGELVPLGERDEKRRRDMRSAVGGH